MNKKVVCGIVVAIALIFMTISFAGCSRKTEQTSNDGDTKVKNIVMWKFKANKEDYMIYDWVQQWNNEHPDIQVKLEIIPYVDYLTSRLPTAFATNSAPDTYMISAGGFLRYANAGAMLPLDKYISDGLKEDFYEKSLEAATYKGSIMGIPIEREPVALFYNKKAFKEKGLLPPTNWDELLECVEQLNSKEMAGIYLPVHPNDYQNFIFYSLYMQSGSDVVDETNRTSKFGAYGYDALNLWRRLSKYNYKVETSIQSPSDINPLATGKAATQICGYWAVQTLDKFHPDFDYGIVPLPYPDGGRNTSVYGGWYQVVNPNSKYPEETAKFIVWMWGEDASRPLQWCTEASTKFPTRKSVVENNAGIFNTEVSKIFKESILQNAIPEPRYPVEIANTVSKAVQDAMFTDKPIEDILNEADDEINSYFRLNDGPY